MVDLFWWFDVGVVVVGDVFEFGMVVGVGWGMVGYGCVC